VKRTTQKELEAPNGLFENWHYWEKYPYKNAIEKHVRKISQEKRMLAIQYEISQFPKGAQHALEISEVPNSSFWLEVSKVFNDKEWWKNVTLTEALTNFWKMAHQSIDYLNKNYEMKPKVINQEYRLLMFGIFQMVTLWISWNAFREKKIRKVIGIKKNIFDF
jgi:hypothetical protein